MKMKKLRIAIDGPGGAGKSTIAKKIAEKLSIEYIDTGAMYRSIAYKFYENKCDMEKEESVKKILDETSIDFMDGKVILDGVEIETEIRKNHISSLASKVSQNFLVRKKLVELQKKIASNKNVVMDGRDIGTNVIKDAELKIFLNATLEERAKRRFEELKLKGENIAFNKVFDDIAKRDFEDIHRTLNPLKKAEDAIEIDTTGKDVEKVTNEILKLVKFY